MWEEAETKGGDITPPWIPGGTTLWASSSMPGARARGGWYSRLSPTTAQPLAEGQPRALAQEEFSVCKTKPWRYCKQDE